MNATRYPKNSRETIIDYLLDVVDDRLDVLTNTCQFVRIENLVNKALLALRSTNNAEA